MDTMKMNANGSAGRTARAALAMALAVALGAANATAADDFQETLPAQPDGTLRVELDRGSIEVEAHTRPEVRVDARADGMEFEGSSTSSAEGACACAFEFPSASPWTCAPRAAPSTWSAWKVR
jgi:hypothetical protein